MNPTSALRQLGSTQQKLLRALLQAPQGASVEDLCATLGVTHNAVRQHLTALMAAGWVARGQAHATGGRPRACFVLQPAGRDLFPRHYGIITHALLKRLHQRLGRVEVRALLAELGAELGTSIAAPLESAKEDGIARALASQLDALGYEADVVHEDGESQVETWNCVFHSLAHEYPDVCAFDVAFLKAASGRRIEHSACLLRGSPACRFRIGTPLQEGATE